MAAPVSSLPVSNTVLGNLVRTALAVAATTTAVDTALQLPQGPQTRAVGMCDIMLSRVWSGGSDMYRGTSCENAACSWRMCAVSEHNCDPCGLMHLTACGALRSWYWFGVFLLLIGNKSPGSVSCMQLHLHH